MYSWYHFDNPATSRLPTLRGDGNLNAGGAQQQQRQQGQGQQQQLRSQLTNSLYQNNVPVEGRAR